MKRSKCPRCGANKVENAVICGGCELAMRGDVNEMVAAFHRKFGVPVMDRPTVADYKRYVLRMDLIEEEFRELKEAAWKDDMVEIADALADLIYVCYGMAHEYGIDLGPVIREVHRTNMSKEGGATREDGKILKPDGWEPPKIRELLLKQGWTEQD